MSEAPKPDRSVIIAELWRRGVLSYKLDKSQQELYKLYHEGLEKINVWLLARRCGKSFTLLTLALEQCLRRPNSIVKYLVPTKMMAFTVLRPLMKTVLADCPKSLRPAFNSKEYIYYFANGSEIQLAGSDGGHAEKLRGSDSHLVIVDEAGSVDDLDYVVKSVLIPTTLTTKAKIILSGTPPRETEHDFLKFIERAELNNTLIRKTINDNARLTAQEKQDALTEVGGAASDACRREYFCEIIKDPTTCVVPEFTPELEKEIVKEWPQPPFWDAYVSMDLGFKDLTGVLFGYFDYRADKLIIQDELAIDLSRPENNLPGLVKSIKDTEERLWTSPLTGEVRKPFLRVSDINYIVTQEIERASFGQITFAASKKDDKGTALNNVKVMIGAKKIIIHPRCVNLINHLRHAKWKKGGAVKLDFARSDTGHHYDLLDALVYFVRAVVYSKNPYPAHYDLNLKDLYVPNNRSLKSPDVDQFEVYKRIFNTPPAKFNPLVKKIF